MTCLVTTDPNAAPADLTETIPDYFTPATAEQAYNFGRVGAYNMKRKMRRNQFLVTGVDHPFPESLWRGYVKGYAEGTDQRHAKLARCAAAEPNKAA
jgi:hypothetical protein